MRDLRALDRYRITGPEVIKLWGWVGDETCGAFALPSPVDGAEMHVIASAESDWDHVYRLVGIIAVRTGPRWIS